jgi:hypothetical protein
MDKDDIYLAVTLETMFTHTKKLAVGACYLYCYAIKLLINGKTRTETIDEIIYEA